MAPVNLEPLIEAIKFNDASKLRRYCTLENTDINSVETTDNGWTLLHKAVQLGHLECLKVLLQHPKIDVNITGPG